MIELTVSEITLALLGGSTLGLLFFGGLKLTIERLGSTRRPALLLIGSLFLRFSLALTAAYWLVTRVHWQALLVGLVGFVVVRLILVRLTMTEAR